MALLSIRQLQLVSARRFNFKMLGNIFVSWMQMMSLILKDWNFNINIWKLVRIFGY